MLYKPGWFDKNLPFEDKLPYMVKLPVHTNSRTRQAGGTRIYWRKSDSEKRASRRKVCKKNQEPEKSQTKPCEMLRLVLTACLLGLATPAPQGLLDSLSNLLTSVVGGGATGEGGSYESAPYTLIRSYEGYEERSYPRRTWVLCYTVMRINVQSACKKNFCCEAVNSVALLAVSDCTMSVGRFAHGRAASAACSSTSPARTARAPSWT